MIQIKKLLLFTALPCSVWGQTFTGGGGNIPDNNSVVSFNINVPVLSPNTVNGNFGVELVCLNINHPYVSDLEVSLRAPDGTTIILFSGVGGDGDNFTNTCLWQNATTSILSGSAPFSGTFRPQTNLGQLNNGQNANGVWRLRVRDMNAQDIGSVLNWSITFGNQPAQPFSFTSSDLPILVINTINNVAIPDEPKVPADMKIIYNGEGVRNYLTDTTFHYNGKIGIERRGSSSQGMPKKPYGFETRDALGNNLNVSLLGMPAENDWVLGASYSDKTLFRNALTYNLANKTGNYAPRTRFCEVMLNGEYIGVYTLTEKIKRDSGRVNIGKLNSFDVAGEELTGGYIIKIDKLTGSGGAGWTSAFPPPGSSGTGASIYFQYAYPDPDSIQPVQEQYIKSFVDSFEAALASPAFQDPQNGWRRFMDENSVIDFLLMNELSRNVDGYRISTFLHKEKITRGNKLKMGPVWDFDIAWQNANYCQGQNTTGWAYDFNAVCGGGGGLLVPFWWQRFREDSLFNKRLYCRYQEFRNSFLSNSALNALADSMALVMNESQDRNFQRWSILGVYVWPNPNPIPTTYLGEVNKLKQWFTDRLAWIDGQITPINSGYPSVNLGPDTAICAGEAVTLNAGNAFSILWNTGQSDTVLYASDAGNYWVELGNLYGCRASDTVLIQVKPNPAVGFTVTALSNFQFQFNSSSQPGTTHLWDFGDGNGSQQINPIHTYDQAGAYNVALWVTDTAGCSSLLAETIQTQTVGLTSEYNKTGFVFPNPAESTFTLFCSSCIGAVAELFSADGQKINQKNITSPSEVFDISDLAPGLYVLQLEQPGFPVQAIKIIKQ
jgi:subtilisin-like proprotein convertase family protein